MKPMPYTLSRTQSGFTLIEALVTFLILAIGLLGLAGLQTKGLQFDQSAYQRTQAALLASDIADRMRANVTGARANAYDVEHGDSVDSDTDCVTDVCNTTEMSEFDLTQWKAALALSLPVGDGSIVTAAGAAGAVDITVTVYWDETRAGASGTHCPRESSSDLMCFQLEVSL